MNRNSRITREGMRRLRIRRLAVVIFISTVCSLSGTQGERRRSSSREGDNDGAVKITPIGGPQISAEKSEWRYQIWNGSAQDVWVCGNLEIHCCETHLSDDNETLLIQRHLSLHAERLPGVQPSARYLRLRKGETRTELVSFSLPIQPQYVVSEARQERPLEDATHVVLEIGYYDGDLPGMILDMLHKAEMSPKVEPHNLRLEDYDPSYHFGSTAQSFLAHNNEGRASKSEWISVPYTWQTLKGEHILRLTADSVHIPYLEQDRPVLRPNLTGCTWAEMTFRTSALDFFFPHPVEQSLLSLSERQYLQALDGLVVKDQDLLRSLAAELQKGVRDSFVWEHGIVDVMCHYSDNNPPVLFKVYNSSKIVTSHGQIIQYEYPDGLRSLSRVTRQVQAFDLRVHCAANLQDLWYRLRLYHRVKAATSGGPVTTGEKPYPRPAKWCDDVSTAYRHLGKAIAGPFKCPGAGEGRCHYAMNPACTPDSPPDMVLLFETNAGWNQHGGPGLFTFDNHDPKGGCVLLNDGTVKFIRNKQELKQLRWK
jgi:hypothetical protein